MADIVILLACLVSLELLILFAVWLDVTINGTGDDGDNDDEFYY